MKLSGSNYGMPNLAVDEALSFHAAVGYRAIEITVLPTYATALERLDAAARRQLREGLRQHGLTCSGIANFENLTDPDPATTAGVLARHRAAIDLAAELATADGTPVLAFMSGGAVGDWPGARVRLIDRLGNLAEHANQRGVTLAMKAHANGCVSRPHHLVDLFEQIGSAAFRFCFDMSHYEVQGLSIEQAMYPLLALSAHVEVKASIGRAPNQEYMIPGEPDVQSDFVGQFRAMRKLGYCHYLVPEMSVHVMRRLDYDPYGALRIAYTALTHALNEGDLVRHNST
jgi:sugar phosphate isomerase/epimerase